MKRFSLIATPRLVVGKKVRRLRREGKLPASLYGKDIKSLDLQLSLKEFSAVYRQAGQTSLIDVAVGATVYPVLVKNVQLHPRTSQIIHAEFHKVNLTEKITARVPLELTGESPAVRDQVGLLLQTLNEVEVEALPADLVEKIAIDVSGLATVDQQLTVGGLQVPTVLTVLTPAEEIIVKVVPAVSQEAKKEAEEEAAAAAAQSETAPAGEEAPAGPTTPSAATEKPAAEEKQAGQ